MGIGEEIQRFIKVWITAISCLGYCYYIAARIPKGLLRLFSLIPIIYLFLVIPFDLSSLHLGAFTVFFLSWLASFKLLLFSFNQGPLSQSHLNILHFICIASLPIKLKQDPPSKSTTNSESHDNGSSPFAKLVSVCIKLLFLAMVICCYDYTENLHPRFFLAILFCHMYLSIVIALDLCKMSDGCIFGFEIEPQFNKPHLATSLQNFWGRRWNLMVSDVLRAAIYHPLRRLLTHPIGPTWGLPAAIFATFVVSGVMHEFIYYYLARAPPTWEVTWFFVLYGACTAIEVAVKKAVVHRGWRLHRLLSWSLTVAFLVVTGERLFFNQLLRNGVLERAMREYAIVLDFVKSKSPSSYPVLSNPQESSSFRKGPMASSDSWMKEYNEALKLADDISGMISEHSSFPGSGPETQRHASAIRRKITILGTRLDSLQSLLSKLPGKQPISDKEMNRRKDMLGNLRSKVNQMASALNMSNFANRDSLLGPEIKPDDAMNRIAGLDNQGVVGFQRQVMKEQDEGLEKLEHTVISTKHIALAVNEELDLHTRLIDDLDQHVDVTDSRLRRVQKNLAILNKRTKGGCSCLCLLLSVVGIVVLIVAIWLLIKYL
ncbi:hypothetical protein L6164_031062 [Bauhinia variegata]|uniref:Uncharacterized protein n=1 Tax=Bauhinia variegata TaxID=167791 RepID=A0ACB9LEB7_BAUVA|nr:hypothetical protein L6164_031062 [Bauhinia variegata]